MRNNEDDYAPMCSGNRMYISGKNVNVTVYNKTYNYDYSQNTNTTNVRQTDTRTSVAVGDDLVKAVSGFIGNIFS